MAEKMRGDGTIGGASQSPAMCDRAEDLITYLYGEANEAEALRFGQHLSACATCCKELAAFGNMREAIGEWRAEALSITPSLAFARGAAPASADGDSSPRRKSAVAAVCEFFSLSPWWLRTGAVAAALVVCALSAFVFARTEVTWDGRGLALRTGVRAEERNNATRVEGPSPGGVPQAQVDEMTARYNLQINQLRDQLKQSEASLLATKSELASRGITPSRAQMASTNNTTRSKRRRDANNMTAERRGGGRDPQLADTSNDDDIYAPRLYDLLRDVN